MAENPTDNATEAAARAAEETTRVIEGTEAAAAAAIAAANEEAENARRAAEQLAGAARESETGRQIQAIEDRMASWRQELETKIESGATETRTLMQTIRDQLTAMVSPPVPSLSSTPAPSPEPEPPPPPMAPSEGGPNPDHGEHPRRLKVRL